MVGKERESRRGASEIWGDRGKERSEGRGVRERERWLERREGGRGVSERFWEGNEGERVGKT